MTPNNQPSPECVRAAEEIIEMLPNIIPVGIEAEKLCDTLAHIIARETRVNELRGALEAIRDYPKRKLTDKTSAYIDTIFNMRGIARAALGEGGGE